MSEMRWNPVLRQWVVTATHRQDRTFLPPPGFCPLCPTKDDSFPTEIPSDNFDLVVFENKFPSFSSAPTAPAVEAGDLYAVAPAQGTCEVVIYTPEHEGSLAQLPLEKIQQLIAVWKDRYEELGKRKEIKYVFIFENKGQSIGVTINHPHGQIYAFSYLPPLIEKELASQKDYYDQTGNCLHCAIVGEELASKSRIIAENSHFIAFVPFYARWPYEVHLYAKNHRPSLLDFSEDEQLSLAELLQTVIRKYDGLFGTSLPYMMVTHQKPTDGLDHPGSHFHIEFYPPNRTKEKLKYLAGCESGAGTFINDTLPEDTAKQLRRVAAISQ
jgi:UDPglucose--hexose-1-phosphate uridylyltransferase